MIPSSAEIHAVVRACGHLTLREIDDVFIFAGAEAVWRGAPAPPFSNRQELAERWIAGIKLHAPAELVKIIRGVENQIGSAPREVVGSVRSSQRNDIPSSDPATMMSPRSAQSAVPTVRNLVFVSYSHADAKWLQRLRVHLKPLERQGALALWDDTRIIPGTRWRDEIRSAVENARVAVLLVTADFLASDFIATNELPPLLDAAEKRGTRILPVILNHCRYEQTEGLNQFQAVNSPSKPLVSVGSLRSEKLFHKLSQAIEEALQTVDAKGVSSLGISTASDKGLGRKEGGTKEAEFGPYTVRKLKSGSIEIVHDGKEVSPRKPLLREIASKLNIGLLNRNGNPLNTRQLGSRVIARLRDLE